MKNKVKKVATLCLSMSMIASMLAACGDSSTSGDATTAPKATDANATPAASAEATTEASADTAKGSTPRNETLYFAGQQWKSINDWNPMSANSNNAMAINQVDSARVLIYETLFMYNMMDSSLNHLLGNEYKWNDDKTELTVTLNPDAKWSDGTQVTADDIKYTFDCHVKYKSAQGNDFGLYIDKVDAKDATTAVFHAKLDKAGKPKNPLKVEQYLTQVYQMQKAYLEKVEKRNDNKADKMDDYVASGPYKTMYYDNQKVVFQRDDNYWGQAKSMWGQVPNPKYIAHTIYADNNAGQTALTKGEVDVCQQFVTDVQNLWLKQKLPISTYIDEAPYGICTCMPSCFFNCDKEGLNQVAVRKAIAMATDFDQIISSAVSNQSPSFSDVPRSIMNPTDVEQNMIDKDSLKQYQWKNADVEGAKKLLDDAGIKDTDGDGIREYKGKKLSFKAECPSGWSDWNAALTMVSDAGKNIGIDISTYFPDADTYYDDFTNGKFDICMWSSSGAGVTNPWQRGMFYFSKDYAAIKKGNWSGNFGHYINDDADKILQEIPLETDAAKLKEYYTELSKIWLTDVPSFALMYRPVTFHIVNESVWTGFPQKDDGTNIPPTDCTDGYGIASLYKITNTTK
ncbi:MAG: ABC transporter substrate-binding protein [bacterium]|nr:ABC transporter substrate-binding protein [bacterium]